MKSHKFFALIFSLLVYGLSYGGQSSDNISVTAKVAPFCEILGSQIKNIKLEYSPFKAFSYDIGSFDFRCVKGTNFTVFAISSYGGSNGGRLKNVNSDIYIKYNLPAVVSYSDITSHSQDLFTVPITMTAPTMNVPSSFYVAIAFGGQEVPVGTYTDTITIKINY